MGLLKGASFEKKMLTPTPEGISLRPIYTKDDLEGLSAPATMPGDAPYLRARNVLGHRTGAWWVSQELPYPTYEEFGQALRSDLRAGQTAVNLILDRATQAGLDPDQADPGEVGLEGTSIASLKGMAEALDGVDLESVPVLIQPGSAALPAAALLVSLMRSRGMDTARLRGAIGMDPLCGLVQLGSLPVSLDRAYDEMACLTRWAADHAPLAMTAAAYGFPYHEAGASAAQELGFTLSAAVEHMRRLGEKGIDPGVSAPRILFGFSAGAHFFMDIARLRAARMAWARIADSCGMQGEAGRMFIHVRTSGYTQSALDVHTNILRGATQAFAAILGGCDSLHVEPFDRPFGLPDEFSRRLARNTQIVLREESRLDAVIDPAGGSWFVERLTHDLACAAWEIFRQVEARGGLIRALEDGWPQAQVEATAAERDSALARRKQVMVGVNQYPDPEEALRPVRTPDYAAIHARRSLRLRQLRESAGPGDNSAVLETLAAILGSRPGDLFETVVTAAMEGATIGEFTRALRQGDDAACRVAPLRPRRASETYEALRRRVAAWRPGKRTDPGCCLDADSGRPGDADVPARPDIFMAGIGPISGYMPRLDFTRSFFRVGGFEVAPDQWFESAEAAVNAAAGSMAEAVVIVSTDDRYPGLVPDLARRLKALEPAPRVLLAGMPAAHEEEFRRAGVDVFIHAGSDVPAELGALADALGVPS